MCALRFFMRPKRVFKEIVWGHPSLLVVLHDVINTKGKVSWYFAPGASEVTAFNQRVTDTFRQVLYLEVAVEFLRRPRREVDLSSQALFDLST